MARVIVISGPSGAGKGTLIERVVTALPGLVVSVSATTRSRRGTEIDGRDYFFLSNKEFERRIDQGWFLEWAAYGGHLYGTPIQVVREQLAAGRDVILEIELDGARQVVERCPDAVRIFIMPPSIAELELRLRGRRTEGEEAIEERLNKAREEMDAVAERVEAGRRLFDYVIVNDSLERASAELARVIQGIREEDEQADCR